MVLHGFTRSRSGERGQRSERALPKPQAAAEFGPVIDRTACTRERWPCLGEDLHRKSLRTDDATQHHRRARAAAQLATVSDQRRQRLAQRLYLIAGIATNIPE